MNEQLITHYIEGRKYILRQFTKETKIDFETEFVFLNNWHHAFIATNGNIINDGKGNYTIHFKIGNKQYNEFPINYCFEIVSIEQKTKVNLNGNEFLHEQYMLAKQIRKSVSGINPELTKIENNDKSIYFDINIGNVNNEDGLYRISIEKINK